MTSQPSGVRTWIGFLGAGFTFAAIAALGAWLGWMLDQEFGASPWLLAVGAGAGVFLAIWNLVRTARSLEAGR